MKQRGQPARDRWKPSQENQHHEKMDENQHQKNDTDMDKFMKTTKSTMKNIEKPVRNMQKTTNTQEPQRMAISLKLNTKIVKKKSAHLL